MHEELIKRLEAAVEAVILSASPKKLVVAGPGAGKTFLFRKLLEAAEGDINDRLILTFINNLKNDLETDLGDSAQVYTFHGYCRRLLHQNASLRGLLTEDFHYLPSLPSLIKRDWEIAIEADCPHFVGIMRNLQEDDALDFYLQRSDYYNAVSFDDSVFRVYKALEASPQEIDGYELVLVDEYQDFNRLEVAFIELLAAKSSNVIAGDDDQALYSQLRSSKAEYIRELFNSGEYERFSLPFCMRCTEPIVGAIADIIPQARDAGALQKRIEKPYDYYPPKKGNDSVQYPHIKLVETTVQTLQTNYFGRYIEQQIAKIPPEEIQESKQGNFPTVLVIGPIQYLRQVRAYLESVGCRCQIASSDDFELTREDGLRILKLDPDSNLGWRIILEVNQPAFADDVIQQSVVDDIPLASLVDNYYRTAILTEAQELDEQEEIVGEEPAADEGAAISIKLTSYEGSKGLSAQHVFILGLQEGDLPRDAHNITDLEVCKFLVALTRTRKQCHLVYTRRWGGGWKQPSIFLGWIRPKRLEHVKVNKDYWG